MLRADDNTCGSAHSCALEARWTPRAVLYEDLSHDTLSLTKFVSRGKADRFLMDPIAVSDLR